MPLVLVNIDNPTETRDLQVRIDAQRLADELGWTNIAVIEHHDPNVLAAVLNRPVPAEDGDAVTGVVLGDQPFATLVKDGHVYEVRVDDENVTVHGRETSVAVPRAAVDGE